jgi:transposase
LSWWADTILGVDLDVAGASTDEIHAAMDWLADRQDSIEKQLVARHLGAEVNPARTALFDLTSSWVTGRCCELAARGYSRDGKKGHQQIEYGLLCDCEGRPVAVRVSDGNTADPTAFTEIVTMVGTRFTLDNLVFVRDRGMITSARIAALRERGEGGVDHANVGSALRSSAVPPGP